MPPTCLAISSESPTTSTSLAPRAAARARPSSSARYSATLLLARPISSECSPRISQSGEEITQAAAAGPGLPRAQPATWTITFIAAGLCRLGRRSRLGGVRERQHVAGHAGAASVAHHATLRRVIAAGSARVAVAGATVKLAPVEDHLDVVVALVVLDELRIELIGEWFGYNAVDHLSGDLTPTPPISKCCENVSQTLRRGARPSPPRARSRRAPRAPARRARSPGPPRAPPRGRH